MDGHTDARPDSRSQVRAGGQLENVMPPAHNLLGRVTLVKKYHGNTMVDALLHDI